MNTTRILAVAVLIVASGLALHVARAQQPGITRTDLQRHDLGVPGREVVQVRVDFAPGVGFPKHSHPGEEIVYRLGRFFDELPTPIDHVLVTGPGPYCAPLAQFDVEAARRDVDAHLRREHGKSDV
jgi:hypothetical protein